VIIGKWIGINSDLFIFDEPTKGIDVGAKSEIYTIMRRMADDGKGVIMVSSELPELLSICDRIIVMHEGEMTAVFTGEEATEEKIMLAATKTL
jgi:D-allose transport system ATP-binding protein